MTPNSPGLLMASVVGKAGELAHNKTMNIEYTKDQIAYMAALQAEIHAKTVIARDASQDVLRLTQELNNAHTKAATEFYKREIAKQQQPA
jgi:hypothetical protein